MEVVVSWNMPMHRWLKLYVFKQTKQRAGAGAAIVLTYLASTVLHGLTGQIAAVLFSLGAYTWVEHSLRTKLSNIMDASIGARRETETRKKVKTAGPILSLLVTHSNISASRGQLLGHSSQSDIRPADHVPPGLPGRHVRPVQPGAGHRLLLGSHSSEVETAGLHQSLGGRADGSGQLADMKLTSGANISLSLSLCSNDLVLLQESLLI